MATARGVATGGAWGSRPPGSQIPSSPAPPPSFRIILIKVTRGAESWWGCSDSETGLLIDSDSGSDSDSDLGSDAKYKINNTLIVERVSAVEARKRNVTFPIDFGFHSFGRKIFIRVISHTSRIASAPLPPKRIAAARSFICSDHVRGFVEQQHRLDGVLLEQGPQVLQEQPHCG